MMIKKKRKYSAEFKAKVVLELLGGDQTLAQICSKHSLVSKSVLNWKKTFLENASIAFNIDGAVAGFKEELSSKEKEVNELHRQLGKRTAELEWASKKLKSLDSDIKKGLIESKLDSISILRQCELFGYNRSTYYYKPSEAHSMKLRLYSAIDDIYGDAPFYGYRISSSATLGEWLQTWCKSCFEVYE